MTKQIGHILLIFALLVIPVSSQAQKKIYTRSFRIQDFRSRTTLVVTGALPGLEWSGELDETLMEDVTSLWDVSPYEFISATEYEARKSDPSSYFLIPVVDKGIVYLSLLKGGKDKDPDSLKHPMKLASVPVAGEKAKATVTYMPAFVSMVQDYIEAAIESEWVAYFGLGSIAKARPAGTRVYKDPLEAAKVFHSGDDGAAIRLAITPDGNPKSRPRHNMTFGAASYRLYSYSKW